MKKSHDAFSEQLEDMKRSAQQEQTLRRQTDPSIAIERELNESSGQALLLKRVGERIEPEGAKHVASISAHIYKDKNTDGGFVLTLATGFDSLPEALAQHMLTELTLHIARKYGRKPSGKRGEDLNFKNDAQILQLEKPSLKS
jgi:hypothetical protein